jgi:hypothetical protein
MPGLINGEPHDDLRGAVQQVRTYSMANFMLWWSKE